MVRQGALIAVVGAVGVIGAIKADWFGGASSPVLLIPWAITIAGIWRAALGATSR